MMLRDVGYITSNLQILFTVGFRIMEEDLQYMKWFLKYVNKKNGSFSFIFFVTRGETL